MIKDDKAYRILIIEDNPGDFFIVQELLMQKIGSPVIVHANSFKQASKVLSAAGTMFDIVLLDITLTDKSGQQLITEMLRIASQFPIIILTGYSDIDFGIKSIGQGIFDYLIKDDLNATMLYKSILYSIERKKSILQIKQSEKQYSDLFHLSPQPMWVFDRETFKFIQVNKATTMLYGYSEEEFLNMTLMDIKLKEDIPYLQDQIQVQNPEGEIFKKNLRHRKKSGEIIEVEIYSTPILINDKIFQSVIAIDITEKKQYQHKIIKTIIKTQEEERYEIGSELHDNVCQILAIAKLSLGMLKQSLLPPGVQWFTRCEENINVALDEIRNLSHRLAPAFFSDITLEDAINKLLDSFNVQGKFKILFYFDNAIERYEINRDIQLNLYRILQEQLKNILKYANASLIELDVLIHNNRVKMRISDNGVGFDVNGLKEGIGMANMKRRAELFSGRFEINSSPGNGCTTIVDIPLQETKNYAPQAEDIFNT